ncbi:conserved hypothetical protein [Rippkaea orientalis PCC 8801]|uniref:DUF4359 domain-containing protein n=1 Tax=Rippkaea orientalis (strain PCC 8801 / RF-1) TaxID=41431 RepID=B7JX49_RIPO1|nr:DUF4359 domain-containing protein [Rippkaea orientalis]ACK67037.1 conserved hypothetical protein [Rippkaea orientalis PCC 8801]
MEAIHILSALGGVTLATIGGLMIITNPGQNDYENYATEALTFYLKDEVCPQAPSELGGFLISYCKTLVDTGRPQIQKVISNKTIRQNYLLFSIYETELSLPSPVPSYQFGTIGALRQFYTYEAQEYKAHEF